MDEHDDERPQGPQRGDGSYPADAPPGGPENGVPGPIPPRTHPAEAIDAPDLPPALRLEAERLAGRRRPSGPSVGLIEAWGQLQSTADIGGIFNKPSGQSATNDGDKHMNDPAPQDTGEFLAVDVATNSMAVELQDARTRIGVLEVALKQIAQSNHNYHQHFPDMPATFEACTYTNCRNANLVLSGT